MQIPYPFIFFWIPKSTFSIRKSPKDILLDEIFRKILDHNGGIFVDTIEVVADSILQ